MRVKKTIVFSIILIYLFIPSGLYAISPQTHGKAGVLIERDSGRLLYSLNPHDKMPMASTTKIMTALVALENGNLDSTVQIQSESVGIEGSSIYLYEGEKISLRDLLYGLILRSGNDSAMAIAQHIGGSVENFVKMMNYKAKEIGAKNTNFTNPHGLTDEDLYTTAYDLALITREALKNKNFREIVNTKLWVSSREKNQYFYNKNKTLFEYRGGDGVKIGYTTNAGRCLVASATRNDMQLIAVVLNDSQWFNDCYQLFDYGFENYSPVIVYDKNQFVKSIHVTNGKKDLLPILTEDSLMIPVTNEEKESIKTVIKLPEKVDAPIEENTRLGEIDIYMNGKLMSKVNLIAKEKIEEKNLLDKIIDHVTAIF